MEKVIRNFKDGVLIHSADKPWDFLPIPVRWHRCRADSAALLFKHLGSPDFIERCRCGARRTAMLGDVLTPWMGRNSRRKRNVFYYIYNINYL